MDYDRIIIEMLNRIQVLEDKVATLEKNRDDYFESGIEDTAAAIASSKKYRLLSDYLFNSKDDKVRLSLLDIEKILGFKPPPSAYVHRAFWANTKTHSIALSWMSVGFETVEVSIEERYVVFERVRDYSKSVVAGKRKAAEVLQKIGSSRTSELTSTKLKEGLV